MKVMTWVVSQVGDDMGYRHRGKRLVQVKLGAKVTRARREAVEDDVGMVV